MPSSTVLLPWIRCLVGGVMDDWTDWLECQFPHGLHLTGDLSDEGVRNMTIWSLAEDPTGESRTTERVLRQIMELQDRYEALVPDDSPPVLFYAWYDAQTGQLRVSACTTSGPDELPFGCVLITHSRPDTVARLASSDPTPGLIPWSELTEVDAADGDEETRRAAAFELDVFVAPLGSG